jgi:hypothetical protein
VADAESAELLQEHLQRAAATRGTDATAAEALRRLAEFRRAGVGADTVSAKGPLRLAKRRLATALGALEEAHHSHDRYLDRAAALEVADGQAAAKRHELTHLQGVAAHQRADGLERQLARVGELSARHPSRPSLEERGEEADAVAAATAAWERRPTAPVLAGPTLVELEAELAGLPPAPVGDLQPHPTVLDAHRHVDGARAELASLEAAQETATSPPGPGRSVPMVAGAVLLASGILLLFVGATGVGLAILAAAAALAGWTMLRGRFPDGSGHPARDREAFRAAALARVEEAQEHLREALRARGALLDGAQLEESLAAYAEACATRSRQAELAGRAPVLRQALEARRSAEASAAEIERAIASARSGLVRAALAAGLPAELDGDERDADALAARLRAWQEQHRERRRLEAEAVREWEELRAILRGRSIADLAGEVAAAREAADQLGGPPDPSPGLDQPTSLETRLRQLASEAQQSQRSADALAGEVAYLRGALPDVAEAEERVEAARTELARVERLAATLDTTIGLLRAAEERVHRNIAPVLAATIEHWLPIVSGGAYVEATLDPSTLAVRVKEARTGQWRPAHLLSEGTREQIYLLLRVAMAQHLVTTGETAPLILDEVTAQSDHARKLQFLEVLHELSAERQVIVFSHDDEVCDWAERTLGGSADRLVHLGAPVFGERRILDPTPVPVAAA